MAANSKRLRAPCRAFSLLEVLVVVAIIALLVAVLIPILGRARAQAKRVTCQANLRQLAFAWHQYLDNNGGGFFQGPANANLNCGGAQGTSVWFQGPKPLNKYLPLPPVVAASGTAKVFCCPCDRGTDELRPTCFTAAGTSYDTNRYMIGASDWHIFDNDPCKPVIEKVRDRFASLRRPRIRNESKVLLMGDLGWVEAAHFNSTLELYWHDRPRAYNMAFMDGHAAFVQLRKGLHATGDYYTIPYGDLQSAVAQYQQEVQCP